jgi:hypothetical protein
LVRIVGAWISRMTDPNEGIEDTSISLAVRLERREMVETLCNAGAQRQDTQTIILSIKYSPGHYSRSQHTKVRLI